MAEKRNASAQSVKADTFDGERVVGTGSAMGQGYGRGVTASGDPPGARLGVSRRYPRATDEEAREQVREGAAIGRAVVGGDGAAGRRTGADARPDR